MMSQCKKLKRLRMERARAARNALRPPLPPFEHCEILPLTPEPDTAAVLEKRQAPSSSVLENTDLERLMVALEGDLNCPVCLDQLTPPVVQCNNGHITCPKCRPGCQQCPVCRAKFLTTPNIVLDQILQKLPKPCSYAVKGCPDRLSDNHQPHFCQFRPIKCQLGENGVCLWTSTVKDWLLHTDRHLGSVKIVTNSTKQFDFGSIPAMGYRIQVDNEYFILTATKSSRTMSLTIEQVLTQKPTEEYCFQIAFRNNANGQVVNKATLLPSVFVDGQDKNKVCMHMDILLSSLETYSQSQPRINSLTGHFNVIKRIAQ